ncbi:hypothetical protein, partial [Pseudomonas sp. 2(2015)]|uniref:hypothetical protein n=1 Tax=Pseudomonas sp. 2(2015) TaxID=1619950 RepID=UPI0012E0824B
MAVGDNLTGTNRDAFLALKSIFDSYGLGSLAPDIVNYLQNGYSSETIGVLLQSTAAYKKRFAANEARVKKGLPALSPGHAGSRTAERVLRQERRLPEVPRERRLPAGDPVPSDCRSELHRLRDPGAEGAVLAVVHQ